VAAEKLPVDQLDSHTPVCSQKLLEPDIGQHKLRTADTVIDESPLWRPAL
jgi:hypothetical protein